MMESKSSIHYSRLVYNTFVRVLKDKKIYPIFKCRVGSSYQSQEVFTSFGLKFIRDLIRKANNIDCCNDLSTVCGRSGVIELLCTRYSNIPQDDKKLELFLMDEVNYLVRVGLEGLVRNSSVLGEVGSTCFTMVCKSVFGDDWVDDTPNEPPAVDFAKLSRKTLDGLSHDIKLDDEMKEYFDVMLAKIRENLDYNIIDSINSASLYGDYEDKVAKVNEQLSF